MSEPVAMTETAKQFRREFLRLFISWTRGNAGPSEWERVYRVPATAHKLTEAFLVWYESPFTDKERVTNGKD